MLALLHDGALAQADRLLRRDAGAGAARRRRRFRNASSRRGAGAGRRDWERVRRRARRRLQHAGGARGPPRLARARAARAAAARARGLRARHRSRSEAGARRGGRSSPRARQAGAGASATSPRRTGCASEIEARGLGGARRRRTGFRLVREVTRELVYGRRPVREALRGAARGARAVGDRARAQRGAVAARSTARRASRSSRSASSTEAAGTRDHQGVVAWCEPYRYADAYELAAGRAPLLVCLDQVTDPHNLGAVCRSAEGAGATGVVVPAHSSARVTPAVCRASAGAVEHLPVAVVTNLARYLDGGEGAATCGCRPPPARPGRRSGRPTSPAASRSSSAPRARGSGRSSAGPATPRSRSRWPGSVESLNVSVAAALVLFEARRQRRG